MVWTRGIGTGRTQEATPLVYDGTCTSRTPATTSGDGRQDRRPRSGSTSASIPRASTAAPIATWRSGARRMIDAERRQHASTRVDARTGKLAWETQVLDAEVRANASSGPIIANGKVITGRQCQPDADQRFVHHHRARREDRQGDLAHAHDPAARRAGRRDVGRCADGAALARRHVDGAELRPGD